EASRLWLLNLALCRTRLSEPSGDDAFSARSAFYYLDRPGRKPSEIVRALLVYTCLQDKPTADYAIPRYGACGYDARRLDRQALDADLAQLKLNAYGRERAVALWDAAKKLAESNEKQIREAAKSDAELKARVFDQPEKASADFEETYQGNKQAIDLA